MSFAELQSSRALVLSKLTECVPDHKTTLDQVFKAMPEVRAARQALNLLCAASLSHCCPRL